VFLASGAAGIEAIAGGQRRIVVMHSATGRMLLPALAIYLEPGREIVDPVTADVAVTGHRFDDSHGVLRGTLGVGEQVARLGAPGACRGAVANGTLFLPLRAEQA